MAALTNIVVLKADGATNITYTGVVPSSGDNTPSVWKAQSIGSAPAHQPELRLTAREASNGTKRVLRVSYFYPTIYTESTTGITTVRFSSKGSAEWEVSKDTPQTDINEFMHQMTGLFSSVDFRNVLKTLYAAT